MSTCAGPPSSPSPLGRVHTPCAKAMPLPNFLSPCWRASMVPDLGHWIDLIALSAAAIDAAAVCRLCGNFLQSRLVVCPWTAAESRKPKPPDRFTINRTNPWPCWCGLKSFSLPSRMLEISSSRIQLALGQYCTSAAKDTRFCSLLTNEVWRASAIEREREREREHLASTFRP
jgi:hypothetical protein